MIWKKSFKILGTTLLTVLFCMNNIFLPDNLTTVGASQSKISTTGNMINIMDILFPPSINRHSPILTDSKERNIIEEDINIDGKNEIIVWNHDTKDAYKVEVLTKTDKGLVQDDSVYPYYFQNVIDYYKENLQKEYNKKSPIMWYYLADAQLKKDEPAAALESIAKGSSILKNGAGVLDAMFLSLKGEALRQLGEYDKAIPTLDKALFLLTSSKFSDSESIINTYYSIGETLNSMGYSKIQYVYYQAALDVAAKEYTKDSPDYYKITYRIEQKLNKKNLTLSPR